MNWKIGFLMLLLFPFTVEAKTVFLQIRDFNFSPDFIEIEQGDTILWTNQGNMPHTVEGPGFDSGTIDPGSTFEFTFTDTGDFDYVCGLHASMTGQISVVPATESQALAISSPEPEVLIEEPEAELGSLSEFFEDNTPAPVDNPAPINQAPASNSPQNQMSHQNHSSAIPQNTTLATSGGSWFYTIAFGLIGAMIFLTFSRR